MKLRYKGVDEVLEVVTVFVSGILALPVMMLVIRRLCRRMLQPLQSIRETAEHIIAGRLDDRILAENPDDELGKLAHTLNKAFDRYRDAMARQQRFASDASHQLRTPLTSIRTTGEVCLQKERPPDEYRETIGSMLEDVQRLSDMVEKLLMLARFGADKVRNAFADVALGGLTRDVVSRYESLGTARSLRFNAPANGDIRVRGDAALLEQMLTNLVDNAVRHTPDGGEISVELSTEENGSIVLQVRDTGPGIPPELHNQLFQRFARGPGTDISGSGLGLAIVADIVSLHDGHIELLGGPGASFRITFPRPA